MERVSDLLPGDLFGPQEWKCEKDALFGPQVCHHPQRLQTVISRLDNVEELRREFHCQWEAIRMRTLLWKKIQDGLAKKLGRSPYWTALAIRGI